MHAGAHPTESAGPHRSNCPPCQEEVTLILLFCAAFINYQSPYFIAKARFNSGCKVLIINVKIQSIIGLIYVYRWMDWMSINLYDYTNYIEITISYLLACTQNFNFLVLPVVLSACLLISSNLSTYSIIIGHGLTFLFPL